MRLRLDLTGTARRPSVNMTPIMDVVFILVIFFLLVAQFTEDAGRTLTLAPEGARSEASGEPPLRLVVTPEAYQLDGSALNADALAGALAEMPARPLLIETAPGAPYQGLVTALDAATSAGLADVRVEQNPEAAP